MSNSTVKKVISGGQTGADSAGIHAAYALGIPTGGTAPKGWRICLPDGKDGSNPELAKFGLIEHESSEYPPRTKKNVLDSCGTVWFGFTDSPGAKLTLNTCAKLHKPYIINPNAEELRVWIIDNNIQVLNVAGNRQSDFNPDIYQQTYETVYNALSKKSLPTVEEVIGILP